MLPAPLVRYVVDGSPGLVDGTGENRCKNRDPDDLRHVGPAVIMRNGIADEILRMKSRLGRITGLGAGLAEPPLLLLRPFHA